MGEFTTIVKGCVQRATRRNAGQYRIDGLSAPGPVFIQSVSPQRTDIFAAESAFNEEHRFFVFGKGIGDIQITLELFLGRGGTAGARVADLDSFFEQNRVSSRMSPITVTSKDGSAYSFFLVGMVQQGVDPVRNLVQLTLVGKLVEDFGG
jgi:hypothetical protein